MDIIDNIKVESIENTNKNINVNILDGDDLIKNINKYVEDYLDSIGKELNEIEQYAHILVAFDKLIEECKKECSSNNIDTILLACNFGDEIIENIKKLEIEEQVKDIYLNYKF